MYLRSFQRVFTPPISASPRQYHERVLDHYERPRNVGSFDKTDSSVGTGLVGAPACGDVMKLQIKVDDNGIIQDTCFKSKTRPFLPFLFFPSLSLSLSVVVVFGLFA